ncbi:hypothetical protein LINPERHAP1_LOCUS15411 [Linum perenne]
MSVVLTGAIRIITTFLSMLIMARTGRQKLFFLDGVHMFISQILVDGIMTTGIGDYDMIRTRGFGWGTTAGLGLGDLDGERRRDWDLGFWMGNDRDLVGRGRGQAIPTLNGGWENRHGGEDERGRARGRYDRVLYG